MLRRSFLGTAPAILAQARKKMNVLLIAIDDMRPELGCYGAKQVHSPNIDALAARGTVFTRNYCQQAVCSPSRTSLLTGLRPDTTKVYDLQLHFRANLPDHVTMPELFKNNGYQTAGFSKIYHGGLDDTQSWSIPWWRPGQKEAWNSNEARVAAERFTAKLKADAWRIGPSGGPAGSRGPSWEAPDVADDALADGKTANQVVAALGAMKGEPFFIGAGFLKPHLPFIAPKRYFDLYDPNKIEMPDYAEAPQGAPPFAGHNNGELRSYGDIGDKPITEAKARELVRAYYAAISYTDAQVGKVLRALDAHGLRENTMVVLFGDHGWHLNNHGLWQKHTNYEKATNSLLIASMPGQKKAGASTKALTEFVDIYPSVAEAAGLRVPANLEGKSFVPLLDQPQRKWKAAAFSQYPRGHQGRQMMGYSMRTERYRLTEWVTRDAQREVVARELYDYQSDPREAFNMAEKPERRELVAALSKQLNAGWRAAG
jgi:arylsulfatase A-like enzyme